MDKKLIDSMGIPLTTAQWSAIDSALEEQAEQYKKELIEAKIYELGLLRINLEEDSVGLVDYWTNRIKELKEQL